MNYNLYCKKENAITLKTIAKDENKQRKGASNYEL